MGSPAEKARGSVVFMVLPDTEFPLISVSGKSENGPDRSPAMLQLAAGTVVGVPAPPVVSIRRKLISEGLLVSVVKLTSASTSTGVPRPNVAVAMFVI